MLTALLTLSLAFHVVYSDLPLVQDIQCEAQDWPNFKDARLWKGGPQDLHEGPDEKKGQTKIVDAFIKVTSNCSDAIVFITVTTDQRMKSLWVDQAGGLPEFKDVEIYSFHDCKKILNKVRIGVKAKDCGTDNKKVGIRCRVQTYGKKPSKFSVTYGAGPYGNQCSHDGLKITHEVRNQKDLA